MTLPEQTVDKITQESDEAQHKAYMSSHSQIELLKLEYVRGVWDGYNKGAMKWAGKAEDLLTALEWIKQYGPADSLTVKFIDNAIKKYNEGN